LFDKNGDGYITVDELKGILANNGEKISDIELNDMIKDADIDGDGKINYEGNIKSCIPCSLNLNNNCPVVTISNVTFIIYFPITIYICIFNHVI
jgi:calmodulin